MCQMSLGIAPKCQYMAASTSSGRIGRSAGTAPIASEPPMIWPILRPPPTIATQNTFGQWPRPTHSLTRGVQPNLPQITTNTLSSNRDHPKGPITSDSSAQRPVTSYASPMLSPCTSQVNELGSLLTVTKVTPASTSQQHALVPRMASVARTPFGRLAKYKIQASHSVAVAHLAVFLDQIKRVTDARSRHHIERGLLKAV